MEVPPRNKRTFTVCSSSQGKSTVSLHLDDRSQAYEKDETKRMSTMARDGQ